MPYAHEEQVRKWFEDVKQQAVTTDNRMKQFQTAITHQQEEIRQLGDTLHTNQEQLTNSMLSTMGNFRTEFGGEFTARFDKLEALPAKRHKTEA